MLFSVRRTQGNRQFLDKMYPTILSPPSPSSPACPHLLLLPLLLFFPAPLFCACHFAYVFPTDSYGQDDFSVANISHWLCVPFFFFTLRFLTPNTQCSVHYFLAPGREEKDSQARLNIVPACVLAICSPVWTLGNVRQPTNSLYSGTRRGGSQNRRRVPLVKCCPSG